MQQTDALQVQVLPWYCVIQASRSIIPTLPRLLLRRSAKLQRGYLKRVS